MLSTIETATPFANVLAALYLAYTLRPPYDEQQQLHKDPFPQLRVQLAISNGS